MGESKTGVDLALEDLNRFFRIYNNAATEKSNQHPLGDPRRVEHQITESQRAHLDLLRTKLDMEVNLQLDKTIKNATEGSEKLGQKVFWLSVATAVLTLVLAGSAILELFQ